MFFGGGSRKGEIEEDPAESSCKEEHKKDSFYIELPMPKQALGPGCIMKSPA